MFYLFLQDIYIYVMQLEEKLLSYGNILAEVPSARPLLQTVGDIGRVKKMTLFLGSRVG